MAGPFITPTRPGGSQPLSGNTPAPSSPGSSQPNFNFPNTSFPSASFSSGAQNSEFGKTLQDAFAAILNFGPDLGQAEFALQSQYIPQQAQLALALQNQFGPGFLQSDLNLQNQFAPQFQALQQNLNTADRERNLAEVQRLSPQLRDIQAAAEGPQASGIRNTLLQQALQQLQAGEELTPEQNASANEQVRSAQFARGFGEGGGSANREAVAKALRGRELAKERQQFAGDTLTP